MLIFEYVMILLFMVLLSNLVHRFIPVLSVPIVQIILGVLVALIPFGFDFEFNPDLFFIMFIAPLIFYAGMTFDKKTMRQVLLPIVGTAVMLVFLTIVSVGYVVQALIPTIPLAVAFAFIASMGPTDDVAVASLAKRVAIPKKIMSILTGESILNDASGIVGFQFAMLAVTSGAFTLPAVTGRFVLVAFGGLLVGLVLATLKHHLVRWVQSLGMENVTLHILLGLLTPFIIYLLAEWLGVSGVLAVFAAGILHSLLTDRFNPDTVKLNIAQDSVWAVLTFSLEGIVFVLLGTQLPDILKTIGSGQHALNWWQIIGFIVFLTAVLSLTRFIWWVCTIRKKTYQEAGEEPISRMRAAMIFSLSGARGTVTLASIMSIPLVLTSGEAFPERDLLILLASGVIILSMLITNFVLPLFVKTNDKDKKDDTEQVAYKEIIKRVTDQLLAEATVENREAVQAVVRSYYNRSVMPHNHGRGVAKANHALIVETLHWERDHTMQLASEGSITQADAEAYLSMLNSHIELHSKWKKKGVWGKIRLVFRHIFLSGQHKKAMPSKNVSAIREANAVYIIERLTAMKTVENASVVDNLLSFYNMLSQTHGEVTRRGGHIAKANEGLVSEIASRAFGLERVYIQEMYEVGRISWGTAKEMRGNIAMLEARLLE